jgi:hypothetical protein
MDNVKFLKFKDKRNGRLVATVRVIDNGSDFFVTEAFGLPKGTKTRHLEVYGQTRNRGKNFFLAVDPILSPKNQSNITRIVIV